jgi:hypothetical protein
MSQPAPGDNASRLNPIFCTRWTCRLGQTLDPRAHQASCNLSPSSLIPTPTCRAGSSHPNPSLSRLTGTCTCDRATQLACALCGRAVIQQLHTVESDPTGFDPVLYTSRERITIYKPSLSTGRANMCALSCHVLTSNHLAKRRKNNALRQSRKGNNGAASRAQEDRFLLLILRRSQYLLYLCKRVFDSLKQNESMFLTIIFLCSHTYVYIITSTCWTGSGEKQGFS